MSKGSRDTRRRRLGPWLRTLAGTCLAAIMVGGPAIVAGDIAAGASALAPAPRGPCSVPSAKAAAFKFCLMADAGDSQVRRTWTIVVDKIVMSTTASAIPVTVPGPPAGLTATAGNAQVTLSWAAPASDGGSPVTGYDLYAGTTADFHGRTPVAKVTGTVVTVAGLVDGTTYYFSVIAVNAVGQSPPSAEASAIPVTVPGAPSGLTATAGNAQVRLSWTAPASDGGSSVISYKVYIATGPGAHRSAVIGTSKGTGGTVTGLVNGTVYYFTVTAVNAAGNESPFSTWVSAEPTGPARGVTASRLISPAAPKQLIALLAAVAAVAAYAAFMLIARRRRRFRSRDLDRPERGGARSGQQMAVASDVRAVPDTGPPEVLGVRDTGREPTHTIRFESNPGVATTTIKEGRP
jgi:hypothetical protein